MSAKVIIPQLLLQCAKTLVMFDNEIASYLSLLMVEMIILVNHKQSNFIRCEIAIFAATQIICNIVDILSISVFFHGIPTKLAPFAIYFISIIFVLVQRCYKVIVRPLTSLQEPLL